MAHPHSRGGTEPVPPPSVPSPSVLASLADVLLASPLRDPVPLIAYGRAVAAELGLPCNPVGAGNAKTAVPSTYRPVGPTCPPCPLAAGCYARYGPVSFQAARASSRALPSLAAAAVAMAAAVRAECPARLHVSGDFFRKGILDASYAAGIAALARLVRGRSRGAAPAAWTYTRAPAGPWIRELESSGVRVLRSGAAAPGGAVVWPHDRLPELRTIRPGLPLRPCDGQAYGTDCRSCGRCWSAECRSECVVFDPHGPGAKSVVRAIGA